MVAALTIAIASGFVVYTFLLRTVEPSRGPTFDLGSLFIQGKSLVPDPYNPCIALQEHLEATRQKSYSNAYSYLWEGLQRSVSPADFVANVRSNSLLFRDISGYEFHQYEVNGTSAGAKGYVEYRTGGRSRVEAAFAREGNQWRISEMTMIYK